MPQLTNFLKQPDFSDNKKKRSDEPVECAQVIGQHKILCRTGGNAGNSAELSEEELIGIVLETGGLT